MNSNSKMEISILNALNVGLRSRSDVLGHFRNLLANRIVVGVEHGEILCQIWSIHLHQHPDVHDGEVRQRDLVAQDEVALGFLDEAGEAREARPAWSRGKFLQRAVNI